jgi:hypothetical protein
MDRNTWHVSEQWLRTYLYERGKEGDTETSSGFHRHFRLAEARATLRDGRQWDTEPFPFEEMPQ